MKLIVISFLISIVALFGCKQTTEPSDVSFYMKLEAEYSFKNDSVQIVLDDKILLDSTITTNDVLSLAWGSKLKVLSRNDHILKSELINFGIQKDYSIDTQYDTTTVLIRFDRSTKEISYQQIKGIILRD